VERPGLRFAADGNAIERLSGQMTVRSQSLAEHDTGGHLSGRPVRVAGDAGADLAFAGRRIGAAFARCAFYQGRPVRPRQQSRKPPVAWRSPREWVG